MTPDELLQKIYYFRIKCSVIRQPTFEEDLKILVTALKNVLGYAHPYSLGYSEVKKLENHVPAFRNAGNGATAAVSGKPYLYRFATNPGDVLFNAAWKDAYSNLIDDSEKIWEDIYVESQNGTVWLPYNDYASGSYHSYCNISWWTLDDLAEQTEDIMFKALKLGLFQNWVQPKCYLLRCRTDVYAASPLASIPSAVDAFRSSVFYPTEEALSPTAGVTINLTQLPRAVSLGISEFALKPIKTDCLDFLPIDIPPSLRSQYFDIDDENGEALETLIDFYGTL